MKELFEIKFNTQFDKARESAERRGVVLPSVYYGQLPKQMRSLSNTISYIQSVEQIQTILDDLKRAIDSGNSFEKWRKDFNPERFGITKAHAETVYRNALQTQYSVGRWEQAQMAKKTHPYLRYVTINDSRTSQCCRALSGIIRKIDDPFWATHTPPNHHRCRSIVVSLTAKEAQKRSPAMVGLNQPQSPDMQPQKGWDYNPALSHQQQMSSLLEKKISAMPNASNWFKNTVREQAAKKLAGVLDVVESPANKTIIPDSMEQKTAQDLLDKLISNAEKATGENKLFEMWSNPKKYKKHVEKRLEEGVINDEQDYQNKTFSVFAKAEKITIAKSLKADMISAKMQVLVDDWIVLLGTEAQIVTSYKFDPIAETFEEKHTKFGDAVYEQPIDSKTREILKKLFDAP